MTEIIAPTPEPVAAEPIAAPAPEAPTRRELRDDEIDKILSYDPFSPPPDSGAKPAEAAPAEPAAASGALPAPAPIQPKAPAAPAPAPAVNPEIEALKSQLQLATQAIEALKGQQAKPPAADPVAAQAAEDQAILAQYAFKLPEQLVTALRSDDPAVLGQGLQHLLQGVGASVHRNVMKHVQETVMARIPALIQHISATQQTNTSVEQDFYGTYPELNHEVFRGMVQKTAASLAKTQGVTQWSSGFRDAVAQAVVGELQKAGVSVALKKGQQPPAPTPAPVAQRLPFIASGAPARVPVTAVTPNSSQDIAGTIF